MLSNEQRAHDIAITMLPTLITSPVYEDEISEDGTVSRDILFKYIELYNLALNGLNREFK